MLMCWKQEYLTTVRIWVSMSTELWWLEDWVSESPKQQVLYGDPRMQWFKSGKSGPRKDNYETHDKVTDA